MAGRLSGKIALVTAAAQSFIEAQPPTRPCIAEYGDDFPAFLASVPGASNLPYLEPFARLEWQLGRLALAVEQPALDAERHTGVAYLHLTWPVDALISVFLTGTEPDQFELRPEDIWLEVRGSRGELRMTRLSPEEFARHRVRTQSDDQEDIVR